MSLLHFTLSGAGDALDGEYDIDRFPNTRELVAFRKALGLTPSELQEVFSEGGMEQLPMFAWVYWHRRGEPAKAAAVLELPFDLWGGIEAVEPEGEGEPEDPTPASDSD